MILAIITVLLAAALAFANGANDVSKGVSTLVGSGLADYRRGLAWGTLWTVVGGLAALVLSAGLLRTFSTSLVDVSVAGNAAFPVAVAAGAFGWVMLASKAGLPVSTTHSLTGAIVGAAMAGAGAAGVRWPLLLATVAIPLAASPFVSTLTAYLLHAASRRALARSSRYCVCVTEGALIPVVRVSSAATAAGVMPSLVVDRESACGGSTAVAYWRFTDLSHWGTSAALGFARGLNDNPKIVALGMLAGASAGVSPSVLLVGGAVVMGLGSYFFGRRVTETLAERVTRIDPVEGLVASGVAATLVIAASFVALPVSTTHVTSGAIIGVGLGDGVQAVRWRTVSGMAAAWLITLPVSAALGAAVWLLAASFVR
jgi:PiT family inorganic phosphate transporter